MKGDLESACNDWKRALSAGQRTCRNLHEDLAISRSELGNAQRLLGELDGARTALEHALEEADRVCGDTTRCRVRARVAYAALLHQLGASIEALKHAEDALQLVTDRFGEHHPQAIAVLNLLGSMLRDLEQPERAREHFSRAIRIAEAATLTAHFDHAESLEGIGILQLDAGDASGGRERLARALAIVEQSRGSEHPAALHLRQLLST